MGWHMLCDGFQRGVGHGGRAVPNINKPRTSRPLSLSFFLIRKVILSGSRTPQFFLQFVHSLALGQLTFLSCLQASFLPSSCPWALVFVAFCPSATTIMPADQSRRPRATATPTPATPGGLSGHSFSHPPSVGSRWSLFQTPARFSSW